MVICKHPDGKYTRHERVAPGGSFSWITKQSNNNFEEGLTLCGGCKMQGKQDPNIRWGWSSESLFLQSIDCLPPPLARQGFSGT